MPEPNEEEAEGRRVTEGESGRKISQGPLAQTMVRMDGAVNRKGSRSKKN